MRTECDTWLSEIFGYEVLKVVLTTGAKGGRSPIALADDFSDVSRKKHAFFYAKVPTQSVDHVQALVSLGFNVVDVMATFERKPAKIAPRGMGISLEVRDFLPEDYEPILDIAASCFRYSRFHLDPYIPDDVANTIKRSWVASYIQRKRGDRLLVALLDGQPLGFLAVLKDTVHGRPARVVDLIGVDRSHQGIGVGRNLMDYFVSSYSQECELLRAGTQISNIPSIRLYESCGFRIAHTAYVLHAHKKNGQLQR